MTGFVLLGGGGLGLFLKGHKIMGSVLMLVAGALILFDVIAHAYIYGVL